MSEEKDADLSVVPPAAPLIGDPAETDQPSVGADRVLPPDATGNGDHIADEARRREDQA